MVVAAAAGTGWLGAALRAELELPFARVVGLPLLAAAGAAAAALVLVPGGWAQPAAAAAVYAALLALFDRSELGRLARALSGTWSSR